MPAKKEQPQKGAKNAEVTTPNSSDGVVSYWSSHLEDTQSELIVPGSHGAYALPQTVAELKRILTRTKHMLDNARCDE